MLPAGPSSPCFFALPCPLTTITFRRKKKVNRLFFHPLPVSSFSQKCDAKRPYCTTCKVADKEKECTYDENVERTLTEALFLRTHILEQRLAAYETQVASLSQPLSPNGC